jgi:hypothetical protein
MSKKYPLIGLTVGEKALESDVNRCRVLVRSVIEMVNEAESTLSRENLQTGDVRTILEIVEEGLVSIRDNHEKGIYDQAPAEEPTEEEHRA